MIWSNQQWQSKEELAAHIVRFIKVKDSATPPFLLDLARMVRSQFQTTDSRTLDRVPVRLLAEARFNAYAWAGSDGPEVAMDLLMATVLPAFAVITWGMTNEEPDNPRAFDPRQLIWLACAVHRNDMGPVMQFPCWDAVFRIARGEINAGAPTRGMVDAALGFILGHEYGHIVAGHLDLPHHLLEHEFEADRLATQSAGRAFRHVPHLPWALQNVFLLFAILEQFEPAGNSHPPASERLRAVRGELLCLPTAESFWASILDAIENQMAHLTSFSAEAARAHWEQASMSGNPDWWRV